MISIKLLRQPFILNIFMWVTLLIICIFSSISILGQDGIYGYVPLAAEYLRGNYNFSNVFFSGQSLIGLYGEQPYWFILKFLGTNPIQFINITLWLNLMGIWYFTRIIFYYFCPNVNFTKDVAIIGLTIFSPVVFNRIYAGHLNILLTLTPVLIAIAALEIRTLKFFIISTFFTICALTTSGYQILLYHIFYIPLLITISWELSFKEKKKYILFLLSILICAILLSLYSTHSQVSFALSGDHARSTKIPIVYSYLTSNFSNFLSLFFTSINSLSNTSNFFTFHELNYPIGISFISLIFATKNEKKILFTLLVTILLSQFIAMKIPPFSLFENLPFINLFRVPQRLLILPVYLFSIISVSIAARSASWYCIPATFFFIIIGNYIPYFEIYLLLASIILVIISFKQTDKKIFNTTLIPALILASLLQDIPTRFTEITKSNYIFKEHLKLMNELNNAFKLNASDKIVHLNFADNFLFYSAANYLGIRTVEGYGNPPHNIIDKINNITGSRINSLQNIILFNSNTPNYNDLLKEFKITNVIEYDSKQFTNRIISH